MLTNLINEVIILITSVMALVVILHAEQELEAHFSIKQGIAFMVLADLLFFIISASPVGLNLLILVLALMGMKLHQTDIASTTLLAGTTCGWIIQIIRFLGHTKGFGDNSIPYLAAFTVAFIATAAYVFVLNRGSSEDEIDDEFADDFDDEEPSDHRIKRYFQSHPVAAFTAGFGTLAVALFVIAVIFV